MKYVLLVHHLLFFSVVSFAQNTVGLISSNFERVDPGYNLIFPHNQSSVYLLDLCGQVVHEWEDDNAFVPGNAVYLLDNGNLVKCKRLQTSAVNDPIWAGGGGETVEIRTWENELLHSFTLNNEGFRLHHDVEPLPNGNILMIAWENKNAEEAIKAGRDSTLLPQSKVWPEVILEWNPILDSIVWEWHAWDHLIQDLDPNQDNFGVVANHPELININYDESNGHPDWLHINAIDYNPVLDQIVLSVPEFNEIWVIDHSTTIEEAKSHNGGNADKGGDLIYRWGNPQTYNRGSAEDQKLFFQHDVQWTNPNANRSASQFGQIILFNNRVPPNISTIDVIQTKLQTPEGFNYEIDNQYSPTDFEQTFIHPDNISIAFSNSLSSAQMLSNGNVLALAGRWGFAYEITPNKEVAWAYRVPLRAGRPVNQGDTLAINNNITFRMQRYPIDYPPFIERNLEPMRYLESMPNITFCNLTVGLEEQNQASSLIKVFPNPANDYVEVEFDNTMLGEELNIVDSNGRYLLNYKINQQFIKLNTSNFLPGIYFLKVGNTNVQRLLILK